MHARAPLGRVVAKVVDSRRAGHGQREYGVHGGDVVRLVRGVYACSWARQQRLEAARARVRVAARRLRHHGAQAAHAREAGGRQPAAGVAVDAAAHRRRPRRFSSAFVFVCASAKQKQQKRPHRLSTKNSPSTFSGRRCGAAARAAARRVRRWRGAAARDDTSAAASKARCIMAATESWACARRARAARALRVLSRALAWPGGVAGRRARRLAGVPSRNRHVSVTSLAPNPTAVRPP
jgi:hypothetical protein